LCEVAETPVKLMLYEFTWCSYSFHLGAVILFIFLQNNVTPNSTPLQPLNGDSPGTLSSAVDGTPLNSGSKKRPSDTTAENSRKKVKTREEALNQVCGALEM